MIKILGGVGGPDKNGMSNFIFSRSTFYFETTPEKNHQGASLF